MTRAKDFTSIDDYIAARPKDVQSVLEALRSTIRNAVPDVTETISYGMPAFHLSQKPLVYMAAWKKHIALYPIPPGPEAFEREMQNYKGTRSSMHILYKKPVPYDLVEQLVKLRRAQLT